MDAPSDRRTVPGITIPERLAQIRCDCDLPQCRVALELGVSPNAVSYWDSGARIPPVKHLAAYARFVGSRLVARHRDGSVVFDATDPGLSHLRKQAGWSQEALGLQLRCFQTTVGEIESQIRQGTVRLSRLQWYIGPFNYEIGLADQWRRRGNARRSKTHSLNPRSGKDTP